MYVGKMNLRVMHISMIFDPDYDSWSTTLMHACIHNANIHDPWPWCMYLWCGKFVPDERTDEQGDSRSWILDCMIVVHWYGAVEYNSSQCNLNCNAMRFTLLYIVLYCACTDRGSPALFLLDWNCDVCSALQCIIRFLWSSARIGRGRMLREFFLHRFNLLHQCQLHHLFHNSAKRHLDCFRETVRCLRMVRDGRGVWWWHPGKLPTSWKAPQSRSGGRTGRTPVPPITMRQTGGPLQRCWFSEFQTFSALFWIIADGAWHDQLWEMIFLETWKPVERGGKQRWSEPDYYILRNGSSPTPSIHCPR